MKRSDNRSTPTTATFRGVAKNFISEQEAYIWLLDRFVSLDQAMFDRAASTSKDLCQGARGAIYFSSSAKNLRKSHPLVNGWFAELNLGNSQKFRNLVKIARTLHLQFELDWNWHALNRYAPKPVDGDALLAELMAQ